MTHDSQRQKEEINQGIPTPNPNLSIAGKILTFLSAYPLALPLQAVL